MNASLEASTHLQAFSFELMGIKSRTSRISTITSMKKRSQLNGQTDSTSLEEEQEEKGEGEGRSGEKWKPGSRDDKSDESECKNERF